MEKGVVKQRRSGQVYAELLCDFMFKRLFGSEANKDILIGFLNMLLDDVEIVHVDFISTEHLGLTEQDRKAVFDISCRCLDGRSFIIEMQKGYQRHFRERAVYYTTYPINAQGREAREKYIKENPDNETMSGFSWDYNLKPVTVVAILNFRFEHSECWPSDRYHSSYRLREDVSGEVMTEVLRFVFLELGRFRKRIWELESVFDKWMYLLKHMHELESIPEKFSDPLFRRLFMLSEIANFTPMELEQYENSLKDMSDYYNIIRTAEEDAEQRGLAKGLAQGREEGLEQGIKQGIEEGKAKAIATMLASGIPVETIASAFGMTVEECLLFKN